MTTSFGDHPHSALIRIPTGEPNGSKLEIPCIFQGLAGKRLTLETPERIGIGTVLSVDYNDTMFLAEVLNSKRENPGDVWTVDLKVHQILTGLDSLMRLREQLMGEEKGLPTHSFVSSERAEMN